MFCRSDTAIQEPIGVDAVGEAHGNDRSMTATCDVCGNAYDKSIQVSLEGRTMTFDSFECALHAMTPACALCGCKIVGHGVEAGGAMYCCAHAPTTVAV